MNRSTEELLNEIIEVCVTNSEIDWSDKNPRAEFVYIMDLIEVIKNRYKF